MLSPATVFPTVLANPNLVQLTYSSLTGVPETEVDADEHWIFDTGNAAGLTGRVNGHVLTAQGAAPTYKSKSLKTGGGDAMATASLSGTGVASIAVTSGGSGYLTAPPVTFSGGAGSGATAHAVLTGDVVTSIVVDTAGTGYTSAPTVAIAGSGFGNGLLTDFADRANWTICMVSRIGYPKVLFGTVGTSDGGALVDGGVNTQESSFVRGPASPTRAMTNPTPSPVIGDWSFQALALDFRGSTRLRRYFQQGASLDTTDDVATMTLSSRNFAFGDAYYNNATYNSGTEIAEAVFYQSTLTVAQITDIYKRSRVRMARRGMTVV